MKLTSTLRPAMALLGLLMLAGIAYSQPSYHNKIPIPPFLYTDDGIVQISIEETSHKFDPEGTDPLLNGTVNQPNGIPSWSYNVLNQTNMTFLGPTVRWTTGNPVFMEVYNNLPASSTLTPVTTTTTHWHGAEVPARLDGGPHQPILPGDRWDVQFTNLDSASTMWYHPHFHNQTLPHVQLGLSGMIISDQPSDIIGPTLPRTYGVDDIPVIIGDLGLNLDTATNTVNIISEKGRRPINIVNGLANPYLEVPAHLVRLRVLNGSTRKGIAFGLSTSQYSMDPADWEEFVLIATDGGYTLSPQFMKSNMIGPGARNEILLDLTEYSVGDVLYLRNLKELLPGSVVGSPFPIPPTQWPGPNGGSRDTTMGPAFLQLRIIADPSNYTPVDVFTEYINSWDPTLADTLGITNRRTKDLVYMEQIIVGEDTLRGFTIDSTTYDLETINDVICEGAKEVWTIHNKSPVAHPFHIHKIFFRILDIDSMGVSIPLAERGFNGPKDDVLVLPNWRLRFLAKFDDYPSPIDDYQQSYMYHCHILTHEDQEGGGMMHQFVVTDDPACAPVGVEDLVLEDDTMFLFPNPVGDQLFMAGKSSITSTVRVVDIQGRTIKQQQLGAFEGQVPIDISGLKPGMYVVLWRNEHGKMARKLVVR